MQLIDKVVDCRDSQVLNQEMYHRVMWERRWMAVFTFLAMIGTLIYLYAVLSPDWAVIDFINTRLEHVHIQLGVWGEWRSTNASKLPAEWVSHFPEPASDRFLRLAGVYLKHYYRAQAAICIIAIVLMFFTHGMALYSFSHHRYMFKRLVGTLYFFTGMCIITTIEILINSVTEWNIEVVHKFLDPNDTESVWDYSVVLKRGSAVFLSWVVVAIYFGAAVAFAFGSRKQKGMHAATEEDEFEDRPVHVGR